MNRRPEEPEKDLDQLPLWVDGDQDLEAAVSSDGGRPGRSRAVTTRTAERDPLWSIKDVSSYLGVPVATIYQWRVKGDGPPATRMGKHLRYEPSVVRSWVREHRERA